MKENKLHVIAKIDKKIYGIDELNTDEVVITEERMNHIKEHHPEVFELIMDNLKETIENPDIVYDEIIHAETRWAIKKVDDKHIRVIIRLSSKNRNYDYLNSIITAQILPIRRIKRYEEIKRVKIVYKTK